MPEEVIQEETKTYTEEQVQELIAKETDGLKAKVDQLLGESKSAKQKARELEEQTEQARREQMEKNQEFEQLYKSEQQRAEEASRALSELNKTIKEREIKSASDVMAAKLTDDVKQAALLSEKLSSMATLTDDGVVFERGGIAIDSDAVLQYAKEEYPFLCKGSGSTGGGAAGGFGGGATTTKGNLGGTREEREAAIKTRFKLPN